MGAPELGSGRNLNFLWFLGVHRIVIFTIRPDTGFAGYLKKIRPDTGYFINLNTWHIDHIIYIYKDFFHPCMYVCISAEEGDTIFLSF
jgi:hypothetical protein